jgi:hypothetical protein
MTSRKGEGLAVDGRSDVHLSGGVKSMALKVGARSWTVASVARFEPTPSPTWHHSGED